MSTSITHRERIFVRAITLKTKLEKKKVTRKLLIKALNTACAENKENSIGITKIDAAINTKKHCLPKESNNRFFVPYLFGTSVCDKLIDVTLMKRLTKLVQRAEKSYQRRCMSETLVDSYVSMWYLQKPNSTLVDICDVIARKFLQVVENGGLRRYHHLRKQTCSSFRTMAESKRVPSLVTYLKYEEGKTNGCPRHQDVDAVFFTALLYLKDSPLGHLHIAKVDLPKLFYPGDVVIMDPRVEHWVDEVMRTEGRQVLVFTF